MAPQRSPNPPERSKYRIWQIVDAPESDPYVIASPQPRSGAKLVPGRLNCISSRGEIFVLSDMNSLAMENGRFLRVYTITTDGGDMQPFPRTLEEIAAKKIILLTYRMPVELRKEVGKILNLPDSKDLANCIAENPEWINTLWNDPLFSNVTAFAWTADYNFGRSNLKKVQMYAIRSQECLLDAVCHQNPNIHMKDMTFTF